MMNTSSSPLRPLPHIGFGVVHHARTRPSAHRFTYGTYFLMLPMHLEQAVDEGAAAAELQPNRPGALSFLTKTTVKAAALHRVALCHGCKRCCAAREFWMPMAMSGCKPTHACGATPSSR